MQSGKAQVQDIEGHEAEGQTNLNFQHMNKSSQITPTQVSQS